MKVSVAWVALAALGGFVLGQQVVRRAPERPSGAHDTSAGGDPRLESIAQELAEIRRLLALRPAPVAGESAPSGRRALHEDGTASDDAPTLAAIGALQERLDREFDALRHALHDRETAQQRLARLRDEGRGIDWAALNALVATWRFDKAAAEKEVELMTTETVLDRFGPPSRVWTNTNGIHWEYAGEGAGDWKQVILRVPDGYVTNLIVR